MEVHKGNIERLVQFSSKGLGDKEVNVPTLTYSETMTPDDVLTAMRLSIEEEKSVRAEYVTTFLRDMPFTYQQLGEVVTACVDGMTKVKESGQERYYAGMYNIGAYQRVMSVAIPMFYTAINK